MVVSQKRLGRAFRNGETNGKASNVEIRELENGGTVLVGYGHAVYAYRDPLGNVTAYMGWADQENTRTHAGTMSTKCQYTALGLRVDSKVDERVEGTGTDAAPKEVTFEPPQLA